MSSKNFYHGERKQNPTPLRTKLRAQVMFFIALAVTFAAVLYKNPF